MDNKPISLICGKIKCNFGFFWSSFSAAWLALSSISWWLKKPRTAIYKKIWWAKVMIKMNKRNKRKSRMVVLTKLQILTRTSLFLMIVL
jgi:hypothetical protein